ncbi:hypothetical protein HG530_001673 [Fusarium avenaceum]|nr:hypothetical protein HG530_001673 [Fusarium avenaceum]
MEDDAAAGLEEEELVKVLEEDGGGLMDGCAGVKTRGSVEALANGTNNGASNVAHLKKIDDGLTVSHLLLLGDFLRLAQKGGELKGFADGGGGLVDVHLFGETGGALEGLGKGTAVDEKITSDGAKVETLSETVEQWDSVVDVLEGEDSLVLGNLLSNLFITLGTLSVTSSDRVALARLLVMLIALGTTTSGNRLLNLLGDLATLEDSDGTASDVGLHELHAESGEEDKEDEEGPQEAEVAP